MEDESSSAKADLSPRTRKSHHPLAARWQQCHVLFVTVSFERLTRLGIGGANFPSVAQND